MPLYEYGCSRCKLTFEELVRSARQKVRCPKCGGARVRRQMSTFAAHGLSGRSDGPGAPSAASKSSGCGGCKGGSCSGCGH